MGFFANLASVTHSLKKGMCCRVPRRISLRLLLTVPFALQMALGMGLVIGLAYRQEQRNLANFLDLHFSQTQGLISQELDQYLQQAHTINQSNLAALRSGVISLDRLDQLHAYLIAQHQLLPDVTTILLGTETGDFRTIHWLQPPEQFQQTYVRPDEPQREAGRANPQDPSQLDLYALDEAGQFSRYLETLNNIDVRDRPWYRAAIASGEPGWSDLFAIGASNLLALNAYAPIYRRDLQVATADRASSRAAEEVLEEVAEETAEEIIGVFSVNIALETLDSFLQSLQVVQRYQGYVFLMEADGSLLANSWGIPSYNSVAKPSTHPSRSKRRDQPGLLSFQRVNATDSQIPLMAMTAQRILRDNALSQDQPEDQALVPELKYVESGGEVYYFQAVPYQDQFGLSWIVVTLLPQNSILGDLRVWFYDRLGVLGLSLVGVLGIGIWLTQRLTRSLRLLQQASQDLAQDHLVYPFPNSHIEEIECLGQAFRQIMLEKEEIQRERESYTCTLESRFEAQTRILEEAQHIAHVGSWEWDLSTHAVHWSAELYRIYGADPEHPVPHPHITIQRIHPEDEARFRQFVVTPALARQAFDIDLRILTQQNEIRYVQVKGKPVSNNEGEVRQMVGITADITDRKLLELELQASMEAAAAATRAKGDFLAAMSHEIRTPMNGILGMLTLLQGNPLDPDQQTHAKLAQSSAESLLLLINDILDFSKIDAGKLELETIDFCVYEQLWEMLQSLSLAAEEKGLNLILDLHQIDYPELSGDPSRLRQIFTNLVGNAIKFTQSGEVIVRGALEHREGAILFRGSVQDTGCGIEPEVLQNLFQPFTQGDASTSRQYGGTGLGLAICKRLCGLMQGEIQATSTVGVGSCFEFTVQLAAATPCFIEQTTLTFPLQLPSMSVLVVEANASQRQALRCQLEQWGVTVTTCASGQEAIQVLQQHGNSDQTQTMPQALPWTVALVDVAVTDRDRLLEILQTGEAGQGVVGQGDAGSIADDRPSVWTPIPWTLLTPLHHANLDLSDLLTPTVPSILKPVNPMDLVRLLLALSPDYSYSIEGLGAEVASRNPQGDGGDLWTNRAGSRDWPVADRAAADALTADPMDADRAAADHVADSAPDSALSPSVPVAGSVASPPAAHHATPADPSAPVTDMPAPPVYTRILLAEDNPVNRMVVKGLLKRMGLGVEMAMQGQQALELLQAAEPDAPYTLVLMDCQMPQLDGYEASRRIRAGDAGDRYRQVPIVAMTAHALKGDRDKCLAAGMDDYLSKPIQFETLAQMLKKWCG